MGSDESHFNVSVGSDGQSHKTVSTNHKPFEEKGQTGSLRTDQGMDLSIGPWTRVCWYISFHSVGVAAAVHNDQGV